MSPSLHVYTEVNTKPPPNPFGTRLDPSRHGSEHRFNDFSEGKVVVERSSSSRSLDPPLAPPHLVPRETPSSTRPHSPTSLPDHPDLLPSGGPLSSFLFLPSDLPGSRPPLPPPRPALRIRDPLEPPSFPPGGRPTGSPGRSRPPPRVCGPWVPSPDRPPPRPRLDERSTGQGPSFPHPLPTCFLETHRPPSHPTPHVTTRHDTPPGLPGSPAPSRSRGTPVVTEVPLWITAPSHHVDQPTDNHPPPLIFDSPPI